MFWKPIDAVAKWLTQSLGAHAQLRLGVLICFMALPLMCYGPFSGEQFLIYEMSAVALLLTGISIVIGAEVLLKEEKRDEQNESVD